MNMKWMRWCSPYYYFVCADLALSVSFYNVADDWGLPQANRTVGRQCKLKCNLFGVQKRRKNRLLLSPSDIAHEYLILIFWGLLIFRSMLCCKTFQHVNDQLPFLLEHAELVLLCSGVYCMDTGTNRSPLYWEVGPVREEGGGGGIWITLSVHVSWIVRQVFSELLNLFNPTLVWWCMTVNWNGMPKTGLLLQLAKTQLVE